MLAGLLVLGLAGWWSLRPTDPSETDGLVVEGRSWPPFTGGRQTAEVRGKLVRGAAGCVAFAGRERSLLVFEHGTRWADDAHTRIRLSNGTEARLGDEISGGGGYATGFGRAAVGKCAPSTEAISIWF